MATEAKDAEFAELADVSELVVVELSPRDFGEAKLADLAKSRDALAAYDCFEELISLSAVYANVEAGLRRYDDELEQLKAQLLEAKSNQAWERARDLKTSVQAVQGLHNGAFVSSCLTNCCLNNCTHGAHRFTTSHWSCCAEPKPESVCQFGPIKVGDYVRSDGEKLIGVVLGEEPAKGEPGMDPRYRVAFQPQQFTWRPAYLVCPSSTLQRLCCKPVALPLLGNHLGSYLYTAGERSFQLKYDDKTRLFSSNEISGYCVNCTHGSLPEIFAHWSCCGESNIFATCSLEFEDSTDESDDSEESNDTAGSDESKNSETTSNNTQGDSVALAQKMSTPHEFKGGDIVHSKATIVPMRFNGYLVLEVQDANLVVVSLLGGFVSIVSSDTMKLVWNEKRVEQGRHRGNFLLLEQEKELRFDSDNGLYIDQIPSRPGKRCLKTCSHKGEALGTNHWTCCGSEELHGICRNLRCVCVLS
jgi:hypothetical protein